MKYLFSISIFILSVIQVTAQQNDSTKTDSSAVKTQVLKDISVTARQKAISIATDKISLNVEAMGNSAGLNVLELLKQAPGVSVDGQDNVKMSGKSGVQILLDGRLQSLNSQQIASLLKGMDAANVKTIEVIANPSSRYDASGNAGIINILSKKSSNDGTSGNFSAGYQKIAHYKKTAAFNLNHRRGALGIFANGNYANSLQHTKVSAQRVLNDIKFAQSGVERQGYENVGLSAGTDFKLKEGSSAGAIVTYNHLWDDFPSDATTVLNFANDGLLSTNTLANLREDKIAANLNYQTSLNSAGLLKADLDWLGYRSDLENNVNNNLLSTNSKSSFSSATKTNISLFSAKADYSKKLHETANMESGVKISSSQTVNSLKAVQFLSSAPGLEQANDFNYQELIAAAYGSYSATWGKWKLQTGIRSEYSKMKGISVDGLRNQSNKPDTSYLKLYPTFFLRYEPAGAHAFGFSYNRRVDRPSFQDQNPYIYQTDLYNSNQGNPLLSPQFTQAFELNYTYKGQTQLKLAYSRSKDLIEFITLVSTDQAIMQPVNAGTRIFKFNT